VQPATSEQPNEFAAVHIAGAVNLDYMMNRAATEPGFWLPQDN
jgi:hypothetical protein